MLGTYLQNDRTSIDAGLAAGDFISQAYLGVARTRYPVGTYACLALHQVVPISCECAGAYLDCRG